MRNLMAATACIALIATTNAQAQTPASAESQPQPLSEPENEAVSSDSGDIVVTAQRRSERLQDVPIAITAISSQDLAASGTNDTGHLAFAVPGLNIAKSNAWVLPRIRGIGNVGGGAGIENPVATYIDGVYIASPASSLLALNNVERVEVLKGPQGTLFGRNATGGLIQVVTRDPEFDFGGSVELGYANYGTIRGNGYITGGLSDTVAADLAVSYSSQADGWGRNIPDGREVAKTFHDFAIRSKLLWNLSPTTQVKLVADYEDTKRLNNTDKYPLLPGKFVPAQFTDNDYDTHNNDLIPYRLKQGGVALDVNQELGNVSLHSITAFRDSRALTHSDIDFTPLLLGQVTSIVLEKQFSQELHLLSDPAARFSWLLGGFYFHARSAWDPNTTETSALFRQVFTKGSTDSFAAFAQATYKLTDNTSVTAGLRYTIEERSIDETRTIITPKPSLIAGPPTNVFAESTTFKKPTWRLAIDHHLTPDSMIYASYNRGFKSGGYDLSVPRVGGAYQPEILDAFEVGTKNEFLDRRLRANISAYLYKYKDIQNPAYNNLAQIVTQNAAKATIWGVEGELAVKPVDGFELSTNLTYTDSKYDEFLGAQFFNYDPTSPSYLVGFQGNAKGNRLPYTSKFTASTSASYRFGVGDGDIELNANYYHNSGYYSDPSNQIRQPAYDVVSASIMWEPSSERFQVRAFVTNLFNEKYNVQIVTIPGLSVGRLLDSPRQYGGSVTVRF